MNAGAGMKAVRNRLSAPAEGEQLSDRLRYGHLRSAG